MAPIFTGNWFNFGRNPSTGPAATPDAGMVASGGIKNEYTDPGPGKNYRAHIFVNPGTFTVDTLAGPPTKNTLEFLVIAGGGGGGGGDVGAGGRAGGGAGGVRTNVPGVQTAGGTPLTAAAFDIPATGDYKVTVGRGGRLGWTQGPANSLQGQPSFFGTPTNGGPPNFPNGVSATGGGGGASGTTPQGPGGSASGSNPGAGNAGGFSPVEGQGGGAGGPGGPGGGGGAGATGEAGQPGRGGAGGVGVKVYIAGPPTAVQPIGFNGVGEPGSPQLGWFAGGGGSGGTWNPTWKPAGSGGSSPGDAGEGGPTSSNYSGAGYGTYYPQGRAMCGEHMSGSGGGGGGGIKNTGQGGPGEKGGIGGNGGSGIVVVRYEIDSPQMGTAKATGGNVSFYNSKVIHTFIQPGNFVTPPTFSQSDCEVVLVGGGGGGGAGFQASAGGGGGGAGGFRQHTNVTLSANTTYPINVGEGGRSGQGQPSPYGPSGNLTQGTNGSSSNIPPLSYASGAGGAGGGAPGGQGNSGTNSGSGGGASGQGGQGGAGGPQYGSPGGDAPGNVGGAGGGGFNADGADAPGGGPGNTGGAGGAGVQVPTTFRDPTGWQMGEGPGPSWFWVAGGGGGGSYGNPMPSDTAPGGGRPWNATGASWSGAGSGGYDWPAQPSTEWFWMPAHIGCGGGGGGAANGPGNARTTGYGGPGCVMIAYPE